MGVTLSEAARQLGYKTRATLYRCRDSGRLEGYLTPDGKLELAPPGLPPLADHLKAVLQQQPQRRTGSPESGDRPDRGRLEAELVAERTRKIRLENDLREGELIVAAEMEQALSGMIRQARDELLRLPLKISHAAVGLGLPEAHRFALEVEVTTIVEATLDELARAPIPRSEPVAQS